jgi:hypothetical protein
MGFSSRCLFPVLLAGLANAAFGAPSSLDRLEEDEPQVEEAPLLARPAQVAVPQRNTGKVMTGEPSAPETWFGMGYEKRMGMPGSSRGRRRGGGSRR